MLRLTPFTYLRPLNVADIFDLQATHEDEWVLMGGGTDLIPNIKHRLVEPKYVIGLRGIKELHGIRRDEDGFLNIGAGTTLSALTASRTIQEDYPALAHAASLISTPQVQRTATLGGNICLDVRCNYYNQSEHWRKAVGYCMKKDSEICRVAPGSDRCWAVSSSDTVPVLMGFDAEAHVVNPEGERWIPLRQFYRDDGLVPTRLKSGEIVTDVRIPPPGGMRLIYSKLRIRQSFDFPLVGVATGISLAPDRSVASARIVMTAVGSSPIELEDAERLLEGNPLTEETIREAGSIVFRAARPMDNTEGSIPHRKRMARVYVERSLRQLAAGQE